MPEELKPLDETEVGIVLNNTPFPMRGKKMSIEWGLTKEQSGILSKAICKRFGQPAVPSVEEIEDVINDCMDNTPESEDWISDLQTKIARAIHNLLRGKK